MTKSLHHPALEALRSKNLLWQGSQQPIDTGVAGAVRLNMPSGFTELDQALQGGWPGSGLVELVPEYLGIGELRLLLPAMQALANERALQAWVNMPGHLTPYCFSPEQLAACVFIRPPDPRQTCWVLEQVLTSACCSGVVFWADALTPAQAKRLQVAARESQTLVFMIRTQNARIESLPLSLRMALSATKNGLRIEVLKRQHAWPPEPFVLDFSSRWPCLLESANSEVHSFSESNIIPFPAGR